MSTPSPERATRDELRELLGDAKIRFWRCPVETHREVRWTDDIAYCVEPLCGSSSAGGSGTAETTGLEQRVAEQMYETWPLPDPSPELRLLREVVALVTADLTPKIEAVTREQVSAEIAFLADRWRKSSPEYLRGIEAIRRCVVNPPSSVRQHFAARSGSPGKEQQ